LIALNIFKPRKDQSIHDSNTRRSLIQQ